MTTAFCVFVVLCFINVSMVSSLQTTKSCAEFGFVSMPSFNKDFYIGSWFMHQTYNFPGSQQFNCYVQIRTPNLDGSHNVTGILLKPGVPELRTDGVATYDAGGLGQYTYSSQNPPVDNVLFRILNTDYLTYYVECACTDVTGGSIVQLYIASRTSVVLTATQTTINKTINMYDFDQSAIKTLNILSCPSVLLEGSGGLLAGLLNFLTGLLGGLLGGLFG